MASSLAPVLQPLQQYWPVIRQNTVAHLKAAFLPPLFHRSSIWHGLLLFAWLVALGLKGLGNWLLLWLLVQGIRAFHQAGFIPALHTRLYTAPDEEKQNLLGQALVAQTLLSLIYVGLGYALFSGLLTGFLGGIQPSLFQLKGPLLLGVSLLCGTLPSFHTMKALITAPYMAAKKTSQPPQTVVWVSTVHMAIAIGGLLMIPFWTPVTQAHVAWLLVASTLTASLFGLLFAGFIRFDAPNPLPLLRNGWAALLEGRGAILARWLLTDGLIIATALWIGPATAAILAVLTLIVDGVLPHAIPEVPDTRAAYSSAGPPVWVQWAPWTLLLVGLIAVIHFIAPHWVGNGHSFRLAGVVCWLSVITLLRHWGGHRFAPSAQALWCIAAASLLLFYWARPLLGLITPLCLWTVAWASMHLLPQQSMAPSAATAASPPTN